MDAIELSSFKSIVVQTKFYSFLVSCQNDWFVINCTPTNFEISDSSGFLKTKKCIPSKFLNFLRAQLGSKNLKANHTVQAESSKLCGVYSIYYIRLRDKGYSFEEILDTFKSDLPGNDKLMLKYLNKIAK